MQLIMYNTNIQNDISIAAIFEIQSDIVAIKEIKALYEETNFNERAEALDIIDFQIIDRIDGLAQKEKLTEDLDLLRAHAKNLKFRLENIDANLFSQLRQQIKTTTNKGLLFKEIIFKYLGISISDIGQSYKIGYDNLDVFISKLLSDKMLPEPTKVGEAEMIYYQKTPARIIFELIETAKINRDEIFFDVGSGLGQVVTLVNMITGVSTIGVEYEPAYCEYATECAVELYLSNVRFINIDARNSDYSLGTIFFLYSPFKGEMLQNFMNILQKVAGKRVIRIFTYGPCSMPIAQLNWLNCITGEVDNIYKLYEFRSLV
jgi:Histone methylation protein DOT1